MVAGWAVALALSGASARAEVPHSSEIQALLADRVGAKDAGAAIVAGVVDAKGRRIVAYGSLAKGDPREPDGDTVFEIGSLTKVFTAVLLMDMVGRGEVALGDPVAKYLPKGIKVPERGGRKITLADLATHTSGLPNLPSNIHPKDEANPFADYSVQQLYDFLSSYELTRDAGAAYEYSSLGMGLLGHVLALRAGTSYEALVRSRICDPLGLASTRITLTPEMQARLAAGHDASLAPVPNWDLPTLAGTAALRSTANDLLTFLAANLGYLKTPLARAMAAAASFRRPAGAGAQAAAGWRVLSSEGHSILWQDGGTGGYASYLAYDPGARSGVVVLTNVATEDGPDDIGLHVLVPGRPVAFIGRPIPREAVALDPRVFDRYVGTYRLDADELIVASREGDRFYLQLTGYPKVEVVPHSEREFFAKNAQMAFGFAVDGSAVTLHEFGLHRVAKKLTASEAARARRDLDAHAAEVARRIREQAPASGSEEVLRRSIRELQAGQPELGKMHPLFAAIVRRAFPEWRAAITGYGALRSVTFKGVEPSGADIYRVEFERTATEWRISLGSDGTLKALTFHPVAG